MTLIVNAVVYLFRKMGARGEFISKRKLCLKRVKHSIQKPDSLIKFRRVFIFYLMLFFVCFMSLVRIIMYFDSTSINKEITETAYAVIFSPFKTPKAARKIAQKGQNSKTYYILTPAGRLDFRIMLNVM